MRPYNAKLWGKNLARMAVDWTGERIAAPKGIEQRFDQTSGVRSPLQADTDIAYPARGGFRRNLSRAQPGSSICALAGLSFGSPIWFHIRCKPIWERC